MVPREWIAPPDADTMDGELLGENNEDDGDERTSMLRQDYQRARNNFSRENSVENAAVNGAENRERSRDIGGKQKGKGVVRDASS